MKLKKIYTSCLCYFLLAALTGVISFEVSSAYARNQRKTELSSARKDMGAAIIFLQEEDTDPAHALSVLAPLPSLQSQHHRLFTHSGLTGENKLHPASMPGQPKDPLYIHQRTLKL